MEVSKSKKTSYKSFKIFDKDVEGIIFINTLFSKEPEPAISDNLNTFKTQKKVSYFFVFKKLETKKVS